MYAYIKTKNVQWTHENKRKCSSLLPSIPGRSISGDTCLFGRLKIGVFRWEEMKNRENHRSEDGEFEDVNSGKSED